MHSPLPRPFPLDRPPPPLWNSGSATATILFGEIKIFINYIQCMHDAHVWKCTTVDQTIDLCSVCIGDFLRMRTGHVAAAYRRQWPTMVVELISWINLLYRTMRPIFSQQAEKIVFLQNIKRRKRRPWKYTNCAASNWLDLDSVCQNLTSIKAMTGDHSVVPLHNMHQRSQQLHLSATQLHDIFCFQLHYRHSSVVTITVIMSRPRI